MEYIQLTKDNLKKEHICCAISRAADPAVDSKKAWLADRLDEGLVFLKSAERGKCFIEYLPAEMAWVPINAPGYLYINCLWVAGSFKGHGYSSDLLSRCLEDAQAQRKKGLCILSSAKKRGFLADPKYLMHKGFRVCDEASNGIQLWVLPLAEIGPLPQFRPSARQAQTAGEGFALYYTNQCPFTAKYVPILQGIAEQQAVPLRVVHLDSRESAQNAPTPTTTFALFWNGAFITNEIPSEKKFSQLIRDLSEA